MSKVMACLSVALALFTGCFQSGLPTCESPQGDVVCALGSVCVLGGCATAAAALACQAQPPGMGCTLNGETGVCELGACVVVRCGDGLRAGPEVCDDGNRDDGDGCSATCASLEACGNGVIDAAVGEQCDDGNLEDGDACRNACRFPRCGDGVRDVALGEACDDGVANSASPNAHCRTDCRLARCGDGVIGPDEACDDGNLVAGDGCAADCQSDERCGNGIVDVVVGEACDDGNQEEADACRSNCRIPACGDGVLDLANGERCDAGDANRNAPDAACRTNCQPRRCGDGVRDSGEACDDGNVSPGDGCAANCLSDERCGNGIVDAQVGEQCDDGNAGLSGDGCDSRCGVEVPTWTLGTAPQATRRAAAACFHPGLGKVVVFGGETSRGPIAELRGYDGRGVVRVAEEGGPPARTEAAMAYVPALGVAVLFGGYDEGLMADTWHLTAAARWQAIATPVAPSPRRGARLALHEAVGGLVLFGGHGEAFLNDTWIYTAAGWTQRAIAGPGARAYHALAYDARRGKVVLFGGRNAEGELADTWEFDGTAWAARALPVHPAPRAAASFVWYPPTQQLWLLGGQRGAATLDDAWSYDGEAWRSLATPVPAHAHAAAAYDPGLARIVVVTGEAAGGAFMPTWEFDGTHAWPGENGPLVPGRAQPAMAWDASRQVIVMFGGRTQGAGVMGDTWEYDGRLWRQVAVEGPAPRERHAMAYDAHRQRIVMYGGTNDLETEGYDETWEYDGHAWLRRGPGPTPYRKLAKIAYDPSRRTVVLFGGVSLNWDTDYNDLWEYDGQQWRPIVAEGGPSGRNNFQMAYDARRACMVIHGGWDRDFIFGETWELDAQGWRQGPHGPWRGAAGMAFDPHRQKIVVFGGDDNESPQRDTWSYDGEAWQLETLPQVPGNRSSQGMVEAGPHGVVLFGGYLDRDGGNDAWGDTWHWNAHGWVRDIEGTEPVARDGHELVFDRLRGNAVLFGGTSQRFDLTSVNESLGDTWLLEQGVWRHVNVTPAPPYRSLFAMAYDPRRGVVVLHGGTHPTQVIQGDTWEWNGRAWTERKPVNSPGMRVLHAMAYDAGRARVVLFGGVSGGGLANDLWEWNGVTWIQRPIGQRPPPRGGAMLTFDEHRGKLVLFGGQPLTGRLNDTWELDGTAWRQIATPSSPPERGGGRMVYSPVRKRVWLLFGDSTGVEVNGDVWEYDGVTWTRLRRQLRCLRAACLRPVTIRLPTRCSSTAAARGPFPQYARSGNSDLPMPAMRRNAAKTPPLTTMATERLAVAIPIVGGRVRPFARRLRLAVPDRAAGMAHAPLGWKRRRCVLRIANSWMAARELDMALRLGTRPRGRSRSGRRGG